MEGRDGVYSFQSSAGGDNVKTLGAVTLNVDAVVGETVLYDDDEPGPAVSQVVRRHTLTALDVGGMER